MPGLKGKASEIGDAAAEHRMQPTAGLGAIFYHRISQSAFPLGWRSSVQPRLVQAVGRTPSLPIVL